MEKGADLLEDQDDQIDEDKIIYFPREDEGSPRSVIMQQFCQKNWAQFKNCLSAHDFDEKKCLKQKTRLDKCAEDAFKQKGRASEQQEVFISQLRQEIYELRQKQKNYQQLSEQMNVLEKKYRSSIEDKKVVERENDVKISQYLQQIEQLIRDLDLLKVQTQDQEDEQQTILEKINDTSAELADKTKDSNQLKSDLNALQSKNNLAKKEIERLDSQLRDETAVSCRYQKEKSRQRDIQNTRDLDNRGLQNKIESAQEDLECNQKQISNLTQTKEQLDADIIAINQKISKTQQSISQQKIALQSLDKEIQYYEANNQKSQQTQINLCKTNEMEYFRGKDLSGIENERRATLNAREDEAEGLKQDLEMIKQQNQKQVEDSYEFQNEIQALQQHMGLLNQQNSELSSELEQFIDTDETIRRTLNRKQKVEQLRSKVDDAIIRSMAEVKNSKSPERLSPSRRSNFGRSY